MSITVSHTTGTGVQIDLQKDLELNASSITHTMLEGNATDGSLSKSMVLTTLAKLMTITLQDRRSWGSNRWSPIQHLS